MTNFVLLEKTVLVTSISESVILEVPRHWSGFLPVVVWPVCTLACWVALAAAVDADVTYPLWLCSVHGTSVLCDLDLHLVQKVSWWQSFLKWSPPQAEQWTSGLHVLFCGNMWAGAQLWLIFRLSTLWALFLTSFWWLFLLLLWFLGICERIYYLCLTSIISRVWGVQSWPSLRSRCGCWYWCTWSHVHRLLWSCISNGRYGAVVWCIESHICEIFYVLLSGACMSESWSGQNLFCWRAGMSCVGSFSPS